ncbi:DUF4118 domain-containing protein [Dactylosporangium sp. NPDC051485]|uniref:DUF4118 domain-containing protein n=1 Tax=Dactylosporangium sp. NPDC051485 TaxID=3154846 RepID=UPI0034365571
MRRQVGRDHIAIVAAVVAPFVVAVALVPVRASISGANLALVLVTVVVAVATSGNRPAGALAALSAAVWFVFFLTQPYQHFTIATRTDILTAVLLLAVGLAVSQLAARARRLHLVTVTDAQQLALIHRITQLVQSGTAPNLVVEQARTGLVELLHLRECRFEFGKLLGRPPRLHADGSVTPRPAHPPTAQDALPDDETELRVSAGGRYYGRFMLRATPDQPVPLQARIVAVTLADQVGSAFDAARTAQPRR